MIKPLVLLSTILLAACGSSGSSDSGGGDSVSTGENPKQVSLSAFKDFKCDGSWGNRDGARGLIAGKGSGTCKTTFEGVRATYKIQIQAQTESDGQSPYKVLINGKEVASGKFPLPAGKLVCDCPDWRKNCPDKIVNIDAGNHWLEPGDVIEFYGEETYPCGDHGAYAKWHGMTLTPTR